MNVRSLCSIMVDVFSLVCYIMLIHHNNTYNYLLYYKRCLLIIRKLNCDINASGFDLRVFILESNYNT